MVLVVYKDDILDIPDAISFGVVRLILDDVRDGVYWVEIEFRQGVLAFLVRSSEDDDRFFLFDGLWNMVLRRSTRRRDLSGLHALPITVWENISIESASEGKRHQHPIKVRMPVQIDLNSQALRWMVHQHL